MDDLLRLLISALDQGVEMTITLRKAVAAEDGLTVRCKWCGWSKTYKRTDNAQRGLKAHSKLCPKRDNTSAEDISPQFRQFIEDLHRKS